jgi:hypothetical protein
MSALLAAAALVIVPGAVAIGSAAPAWAARYDICLDADGVTEIECPPVEEPPVEEPPVEQPPAEQPPAEVPAQEETYYEEEEEEEEPAPAVVTPPVVVQVPKPTPTPTASAAPVPAGWDAPLYSGEGAPTPNTIAIGALIVSGLVAIGIGGTVLVRRILDIRRKRRRAPKFISKSMTVDEARVKAPANLAPTTEFTAFDRMLLDLEGSPKTVPPVFDDPEVTTIRLTARTTVIDGPETTLERILPFDSEATTKRRIRRPTP